MQMNTEERVLHMWRHKESLDRAKASACLGLEGEAVRDVIRKGCCLVNRSDLSL